MKSDGCMRGLEQMPHGQAPSSRLWECGDKGGEPVVVSIISDLGGLDVDILMPCNSLEAMLYGHF